MSDTTHEAPERIWAKPSQDHGWLHGFCSDVLGDDVGGEYIRADLVQAAKMDVAEIARQTVWNKLNGSQQAEQLCDAIAASIRKGSNERSEGGE